MENKDEILKDLKKYTDLKVLMQSEGGKVLTDNLKKDIARFIDRLTSDFREVEHSVLIGHCASLQANLSLLRALQNSESNAKLVQEVLEEGE